MPVDLQPQQLRALRAVIETGSFTAASERLGFTQSALSKQIGALEAATGVQLFVRGARGAAPTPTAERLAVRAEAILDELDAAARELTSVAPPLAGRVMLGGFPATAIELVPRTIARLRVDHPSLEVEFAEASTPVLLRRLRAGRVRLAVLGPGAGARIDGAEGLIAEPLPSGHLHVAVSRHHRLAARGRVAVTDLADEVWVGGRTSRGTPQFGAWPTLAAPRVGRELADWSARLGFVAAGLGITTVPSLALAALPADVVAVAVDDPDEDGQPLLLGRVRDLDAASSAVRAALIATAAGIADVG